MKIAIALTPYFTFNNHGVLYYNKIRNEYIKEKLKKKLKNKSYGKKIIKSYMPSYNIMTYVYDEFNNKIYTVVEPNYMLLGRLQKTTRKTLKSELTTNIKSSLRDKTEQILKDRDNIYQIGMRLQKIILK